MNPPIEHVRRFNRFYTRYVGALQREFLDTPFSLAEASVLYELAHSDNCTATDLAKELSLEKGYLSRILRGLTERGFVRKKRSTSDARQSHLALTDQGKKAFAPVDQRQHEKVAQALSKLSGEDQQRLAGAMQTIQEILVTNRAKEPAYILRTALRPGDIGWVVERHGTLYACEYGWNEECEALIAEIAARFARSFNPQRERCWIAERNGANAGCVFLVEKSKQVAQLRLLIVDPSARGFGIGKRLVRECIDFAASAGYRKIILWTNDVLRTARHLYEEAGFRLVKSERHHSFGKDLIGQYWEKSLVAH